MKEAYETFCGRSLLRLCNWVEDANSLPTKYALAAVTVGFGLLSLSALELWEQADKQLLWQVSEL